MIVEPFLCVLYASWDPGGDLRDPGYEGDETARLEWSVSFMTFATDERILRTDKEAGGEQSDFSESIHSLESGLAYIAVTSRPIPRHLLPELQALVASSQGWRRKNGGQYIVKLGTHCTCTLVLSTISTLQD